MRNQSPTARALVLALVVAPGCGPTSDGINRQPVSGAVTLDKKPLIQGGITFTPLADGPSAGGTIDRGRYSIARADGPAPGSYRVSIVAIQPTGRKRPDPEGPPGASSPCSWAPLIWVELVLSKSVSLVSRPKLS